MDKCKSLSTWMVLGIQLHGEELLTAFLNYNCPIPINKCFSCISRLEDKPRITDLVSILSRPINRIEKKVGAANECSTVWSGLQILESLMKKATLRLAPVISVWENNEEALRSTCGYLFNLLGDAGFLSANLPLLFFMRVWIYCLNTHIQGLFM